MKKIILASILALSTSVAAAGDPPSCLGNNEGRQYAGSAGSIGFDTLSCTLTVGSWKSTTNKLMGSLVCQSGGEGYQVTYQLKMQITNHPTTSTRCEISAGPGWIKDGNGVKLDFVDTSYIGDNKAKLKATDSLNTGVLNDIGKS